MSLLVEYWGHGYATGYGISAQRLVRALLGAGVGVRWRPIDFGVKSPDLPADRRSHGGLDAHRDVPGRADVVVVHAVPEVLPAAFAERGDRPLVCHTVWETDRLQSHWPELLNRCDLVIVPTEWNAEVFRDGGVTVPVAVVPHVAPDPEPADTRWLEELDGRFLVYTIAAWSLRKTPWRVLEAVAHAFGGDDEVALVLVSGSRVESGLEDFTLPPPVQAATWAAVARTVARLGPMPEFRYICHVLTDDAVRGLHRRGDCWVSLPHGEGWDLGAFDAACAGTPVITTGWGAPPTYLDPGASWLVPAELVPAERVYRPDDPAAATARWAEPDLDAAVAALREVRADPGAARRRAADQAAALTERYSPAAVATTFLDALGTHLGLRA